MPLSELSAASTEPDFPTLYSDVAYTKPVSISTIKNGDTVYVKMGYAEDSDYGA